MAADAKKPTAPANHWRQILKRKNANMLYAEDLGPQGTKIDVQIDESGTVVVTGADGKKAMPYIAKRGAKKLGLNATNCKTLETITGSADWKDWLGWFTFVVIRTSYRDMKSGQQLETDAIRIAPQRPRPNPNDRPRQMPPLIPDAPASWVGMSSDPLDAENEWRDLTDEERAEILRKEASKP